MPPLIDTMRIALITDTFLPKIDGIVTTICHVLDHLASVSYTHLTLPTSDLV